MSKVKISAAIKFMKLGFKVSGANMFAKSKIKNKSSKSTKLKTIPSNWYKKEPKPKPGKKKTIYNKRRVSIKLAHLMSNLDYIILGLEPEHRDFDLVTDSEGSSCEE